MPVRTDGRLHIYIYAHDSKRHEQIQGCESVQLREVTYGEHGHIARMN